MKKLLQILSTWRNPDEDCDDFIELSKTNTYIPIDTQLEHDFEIYTLTLFPQNCVIFKVPKGSIINCEIVNGDAIIKYMDNSFEFKCNNRVSYRIKYGSHIDLDNGCDSLIHSCEIIESNESFEYLREKEMQSRFLLEREYESLYFKTFYSSNSEYKYSAFGVEDSPLIYERIKLILQAEFPQYFDNQGNIDISSINNIDDLSYLLRREGNLYDVISEPFYNRARLRHYHMLP